MAQVTDPDGSVWNEIVSSQGGLSVKSRVLVSSSPARDAAIAAQAAVDAAAVTAAANAAANRTATENAIDTNVAAALAKLDAGTATNAEIQAYIARIVRYLAAHRGS